MNEDQLETLDATIARLQGVRHCSIENGDIHDHYDCRNDIKMAVLDLNILLNETEA